MIALKKAKGIVFICISVLIVSLLMACSDAGAGAAAAAGDGNGGDPGSFVRAAATVASTTVAWTSESPSAGSLASAISGSGPYTLTVPDGTNAIHAVVVGGGGSAYQQGGGAGYIRAGGFTVEPGEVLTLTVGAGGTLSGTTAGGGGTTSIVAGSDTIMSAEGGQGGSDKTGGDGSGGGGARVDDSSGHPAIVGGSRGGYCANGLGLSIGTPGEPNAWHPGAGGNNAAKSSGFGAAPDNCTDAKSSVKYGAGGASYGYATHLSEHRGGRGGSADEAGLPSATSDQYGTAGADHYGAGAGGNYEVSGIGNRTQGGSGVIVLYVD